MRASPQVGWSSVARILIVVVLPAPLGPMKPKQSPSLISRLRFDSATSVPYRFVRLTVLMTTAIGANSRSFVRPRGRLRCRGGVEDALVQRQHKLIEHAARAVDA